jgi:Holliday junction resolvasome RuvABC endonuclease subunit
MRGPEYGLVLGFHPSSYGFGWAAFSSPLSLYDWGHCQAKTRKNERCLRRLEKLLRRLAPQAIVLEAFDTGEKRSQRIVDLCHAVVSLAMEERIEVMVYTRREIQSVFGAEGARTRQQVAETVARHHEPLRAKLPRPRRAWDPPDRRMAIFDAAAAVMTHYQVSAASLLRGIIGEDL